MEIRKEWVRPLTTVQQFVPNEYCSSCGDSGKTYNFKCDAPGGYLYYYPYSDGKVDGVHNNISTGYFDQYKDNASLLGAYHPCDAFHIASATDDFYDGFVDYNRNGKYDSNEGVIVWRGKYGYNGHATKNLKMDKWETAKS